MTGGTLVMEIVTRQVIDAAHATVRILDSLQVPEYKVAQTLLEEKLNLIAPGLPVISSVQTSAKKSKKAKEVTFESAWLTSPLHTSRHGRTTLSIALVNDGTPVVGVVYAVADGITYWAAEGLGAWLMDGKTQTKLDCGQCTPPVKVAVPADASDAVEQLAKQFGDTMKVPDGPLGLLQLAQGAADIYCGLSAVGGWDIAAADIIVRKAGGALLQAGASNALGKLGEDWKGVLAKQLPMTYKEVQLHFVSCLGFAADRATRVAVLHSLQREDVAGVLRTMKVPQKVGPTARMELDKDLGKVLCLWDGDVPSGADVGFDRYTYTDFPSVLPDNLPLQTTLTECRRR